MALSHIEIHRLYLAYFGRPPDAAGAAFFNQQFQGGLFDAASAMGASPETAALIAATQTSAGYINALYRQLFGRDAEQGGVDYWSAEVSSGRLQMQHLPAALVLGAQNEDIVAVQNKVTVSEAFSALLDTGAEQTGYAGEPAAAMARAFLGGVGATPSGAGVSAALAGHAVAAASSGQAPDLSMTAGVDFLVDNTGGDNELIARYGDAQATLNAGDCAYGHPTRAFIVTTVPGATENSAPAFIASGFRLVQMRNESSFLQTFDANALTHNRFISIALAESPVRIHSLADGQDVVASHNEAAAVFEYAASAAYASLVIGNFAERVDIGGAGIVSTSLLTGVVVQTGNGVRVQHLNLTGAQNRSLGIELEDDFDLNEVSSEAAGTTVVASAAEAYSFTAGRIDAEIASWNASALTGSVDMHTRADSAFNAAFLYTGSQGDDTYHLRGQLTTGHLEGGAGHDVLLAYDAAFIADTSRFSGFEEVRVVGQ